MGWHRHPGCRTDRIKVPSDGCTLAVVKDVRSPTGLRQVSRPARRSRMSDDQFHGAPGLRESPSLNGPVVAHGAALPAALGSSANNGSKDPSETAPD
jgi:hypothetical protein